MNSGRLPVSRSSVSTVLRQMSTRAPCATRLSTILRLGFSGLQQFDARAERHDLDRDLVGVVELHEIVGDAEHEALLARVIIGELQHDLVLGERLVLQRRLLRAGDRRGGAIKQRRDHRRATMVERACHPCPRDARIAFDAFQRHAWRLPVRRLARAQMFCHHIPDRRAVLLVDRGPSGDLVIPAGFAAGGRCRASVRKSACRPIRPACRYRTRPPTRTMSPPC